MKQVHTFCIPSDVPKQYHANFTKNYDAITKGTNRTLLFAADHKLEHLNTDFYGPSIHDDALNPAHLFQIASRAPIGALATHLGLIARYAPQYSGINYIVKLNGKTNSTAQTSHDPLSQLLWSIDEVIQFKVISGLPIRGIAVTLYLGSTHEHTMLAQAAHAIYHAHQHGLLAILWGYLSPQLANGNDFEQISAGIVGIANGLGADFVKIKPIDPHYLPTVTKAAGNTGVICAGGSQMDTLPLLEQTYRQINEGNTAGSVIGRNIFQHSLAKAIMVCEGLASVIYENKPPHEAVKNLLL